MDLTFRSFKKETLIKQGDILGYSSVWMGQRGVVPLTVGADISKVMDKETAESVTQTMDWPSYISAPITKGRNWGV